jgi:hypothetical protein
MRSSLNWSIWIAYIQRLAARSVRLLRAIDAPIDGTMHHSQQPTLVGSPRKRVGSYIHDPSDYPRMRIGQAWASRTEDLCPLAYSRIFPIDGALGMTEHEQRINAKALRTCFHLIIGETIGN